MKLEKRPYHLSVYAIYLCSLSCTRSITCDPRFSGVDRMIHADTTGTDVFRQTSIGGDRHDFISKAYLGYLLHGFILTHTLPGEGSVF